MNIAICDDEDFYVENIKQHLNYFSKDKNIEFEISAFETAADVLNCGIKFDIAILDVEMDGMNGLELGERLRKINPHIILMYITAHRKYLDDALNLSAVRFFEKPIDSNRFYRGISDAIKRIDNSTINFYLKDRKTAERINAQDIIFVEIENRKSKIITHDKEYHSANHISFWKDKLQNTIFVSPHKSYIVNMNYITSYERNHIILDNKYEISIARNKQSDFYKSFMRYMEIK